MQWSLSLIRQADKDTLIENVIELLKRMGFRNYERVSSKARWGIDVVAIRDDPIAGTEKVVLTLHSTGLASSKDVNVFADIVERYKADKGILISPIGFTKDAKVLISREYRGRIVPWDGEKLVLLFNNYSIEPPEDIEEPQETDNEREETSLRRFELDAPLLYEFSPEATLKRVASAISEKYPVPTDEVKLGSISVILSSAYIFSWSIERGEGKEEKDKAVIFSKNRVVLKATEDKKLSVSVTKALLNDRSVIRATEREIEVPVSPSEAVFILKEAASREFGVPEGMIKIHERKKVYVPRRVELGLKVGENTAQAFVDLKKDELEFKIEPLPDEYFVERTGTIIEKQTKESVLDYTLKRFGGKVKVTGKTERFSFELSFNEYTGKLLGSEITMKDDALRKLIEDTYPGGRVINLDKGKKIAIADVLVEDRVAILQIDLTSGEHIEIRKLPSPVEAFETAREVVEQNFPLGDLKLDSYRVLEHKYLELSMSSPDGTVVVKVDGQTGDVLDYVAEITPEKARELASEKYGDFNISVVESDDTGYLLRAENERHVVTLKVSRDGKLIEEVDRVLREDIVKELAEKSAREIDEEATIKTLTLKHNWEVEFLGRARVGKLTLDRASGEVIDREVRFTEMAIKDRYLSHVREKYGENNPLVERMTLYGEKGHVNIKVVGRETIYYARIDVTSGKIISEDRAPAKGLTAKLKQFQLENKYK